MAKRVLYLGMALDIMTPMLLIPDFRVIYTINKVDKAPGYGGTIENIMEKIKLILTSGEYYQCNNWEHENLIPPCKCPRHKLNCKSIITEDKYDKESQIWRLKFIYNNTPRDLVYYFDYNFLDEWAPEINNIGHIITYGSWLFEWFVTEEKGNTSILKKMFETRSKKPWIYTQAPFNPEFKKKIIFNGSIEPYDIDGCEINVFRIRKFTPKWWEKYVELSENESE